MRLALALLLIVLPLSSPLAQSLPPDLDATVERAMKTFEVPGVALAVVKDGKVLLAKGYGVRKQGAATPVTADTLFNIASNSKAFTAAALAILVDEGKLQWDDRVVDHLPSFQMFDPYVTRELTVRDLLVHRSGLGLGAGDLLYFPPTTFTEDEIVSKLRHIRPSISFRSRYAYDNILYLVAGKVIEKASGRHWRDFVRERIFLPLGMRDSSTHVKGLRVGANVATPHAKADGVLKALSPTSIDNNAPAAAINSTVNDLAKWMMTQLGRGAIPGTDGKKRLFSEAQSKEMWAAQTVMGISEPSKSLESLRANFSAYALGWGVRDYRGYKLVGHSGALPGYFSRVMLVPELGLGIAVLTNQEERSGFEVPLWTVLDAFVGAPKTDWVAAFKADDDSKRAKAEEKVALQGGMRNAQSKPSLPLDSYAGTYRDAWYGDVTVTKEGDKWLLRFTRTPGLVGELSHWQYDTFVARWTDRSLNADAFVTFSLKPDGTLAEMRMQPISPLTDFSFDFQDLLFTPVKQTPAAAVARPVH
ncbi:beta-lactamase [Myxococcus stipitatus DSM 14675]|uniref:Beta-lactamase n=1 Tax=Myxococcus stipitatus (strain DSM 14675 / JCM 12634 / Mx s8) TaxID=1278073 RepID=L7UMQ1_MYXSD|nr:serine hydrolase [Myxococcus stipitatus]AGC47749.1 beta-lactamase [Myxococcus stipitatus DSM 14675]